MKTFHKKNWTNWFMWIEKKHKTTKKYYQYIELGKFNESKERIRQVIIVELKKYMITISIKLNGMSMLTMMISA